MRPFVETATLLLFSIFDLNELASTHPICLDDGDPTHRPAGSEKFKICEQFEYFGCCDAESENRINERFESLLLSGITTECSELLKELLCQECSPLSGHIYLTEHYYQNRTQPLWPGLCKDFCHDFYDKCNATLLFPANSKDDFCTQLKAVDEYYCYPYVNNQVEEENQETPGCLKMCFKEVANNLYQPLAAKSATDGTNRFFVMEQRGYIWTYLANMSKISHPPFLNITDRIAVDLRKYDVKGLIDFTLHPRFKENGFLYVYYCHMENMTIYTRISQFKVSDGDMNVVDADSEMVVLNVKQDNKRHNGGSLLFGPDGLLYFGFGDGGHLKEIYNRGQDMTELLGKMIRIDIEPVATNGTAYGIPADNPYVGMPGVRPEIFATGFRNPWRCTVDKGDPLTGKNKGRIFCGDVGLQDYEEINLVEKGKNYGWRIMEGFNCTPRGYRGECTEASMRNMTSPIAAYRHEELNCIIGGYVYRGCLNPELRGLYITSALRKGGLQALKEEENGTWTKIGLCRQREKICKRMGLTSKKPYSVLSLSEDLDGELYILSTETPGPGFASGKIHKFVHTPDIGSRSKTSGKCSPSPTYHKTTMAANTELEHYKFIPELEVRLMKNNITNNVEGRLEVRFENDVWGTVCGRVFSKSSADVVCKMTPGNRKIGIIQHDIPTYGKGSGRIWMKNLNCRGHEKSLLNCYHDGWGNKGNCTHDEDVAIKCN